VQECFVHRIPCSRQALTLLASKIEKAPTPCVEAWEATNLFQLAQAILKAALIRQETRGSHWREDFPETSIQWRKTNYSATRSDGYLDDGISGSGG